MKKKYKIELHFHSRASKCCDFPIEESIKLYAAAKYDAILVTDHFHSGYFTDPTAKAFVRRWMEEGYEKVVREAEKYGIKVYLGAEYKINRDCYDILLFGCTEEKLVRLTEFFPCDHKELKEECERLGVLLYQAHPYRGACKPLPPDVIDGVEVYNGHPGHDSKNDLALKYAEENGLPQVTGTDLHHKDHIPRGGIITDTLPENAEELRDIIASGKYELIKGE